MQITISLVEAHKGKPYVVKARVVSERRDLHSGHQLVALRRIQDHPVAGPIAARLRYALKADCNIVYAAPPGHLSLQDEAAMRKAFEEAMAHIQSAPIGLY